VAPDDGVRRSFVLEGDGARGPSGGGSAEDGICCALALSRFGQCPETDPFRWLSLARHAARPAKTITIIPYCEPKTRQLVAGGNLDPQVYGIWE